MNKESPCKEVGVGSVGGGISPFGGHLEGGSEVQDLARGMSKTQNQAMQDCE
jgi:hypothetical protein